jgi:hypothetical protein
MWTYYSISASGNLHDVCEMLNKYPEWEFVAFDGRSGSAFTLLYRVRANAS